MIKPLRAAMGLAPTPYRSYAELARALQKAAPTLRWLGPRSLEIKLGQLDGGESGWWAKRPEHLAALAALLEVVPAELGVLRPADRSDRFPFEDFPELPPLDLEREAPCHIARAVPCAHDTPFDERGWFGVSEDGGPRRELPHQLAWLHVRSGLGRQLLLSRLRVGGRVEQLHVRRLADARERLARPEPCVLVVEGCDGVEDLGALGGRPKGTGVLIVAPVPCPQPDTNRASTPYEWDWLVSDGMDPGLGALAIDDLAGKGLKAYRWELLPDWRVTLLQWVEARLRRHGLDTLMTAEGLSKWIGRFDPLGRWIDAPEALMVLCRLAHRMPETRFPEPAAPDVSEAVLESALTLDPATARIFRRIVEARWQALELPWEGPLQRADWARLAPPFCGPLDPDDFLAVANGPNRERRCEAARQLAERLSDSGIETLIADGYLVGVGQGLYALRPTSLANLVIRDWLIGQIATASSLDWGRACFDPSRRHLVDAALACFTPETLVPLAETITRKLPWTADAVAASESLFVALARRLPPDGSVPAALWKLAMQVVARLRADEPDGKWIVPWSRTLHTEDEKEEWLASCWAWSLAMPADGERPPSVHAWQFPGWLPEAPAEGGGALLFVDLPQDAPPSAGLKWLLEVGVRIVERWTRAPVEPPAFLMPCLVIAAGRGRWAADPAWWGPVHRSPWVQDFVRAHLASEGRGAAQRLWLFFLSHERNLPPGSVEKIHLYFGSIRTWILTAVAPETLLRGLDAEDSEYLLNVLATLPPGLRSALLSEVPPDDRRIPQILKAWPPTDAGSFLRRCLDGPYAWLAVELLWRTRPDEAAHLLLSSDPSLGRDARRSLLDGCPAEHTALCLPVLREPGLLDEAALRAWIKIRLPASGRHAPALLAALSSKDMRLPGDAVEPSPGSVFARPA